MGIPESFKVGWYPPKKTGSSHLKGGHLGFKSTEGAGIGVCSGKGWGREASQLLLKDHTAWKTKILNLKALTKGPSLRFTYLDRHLCHHKELFNADKQPTKERVLK